MTKSRGKPSYADLRKMVGELRREIDKKRGRGRPRKPPELMVPTGKFTLEIEQNNKVIRRFRGLSGSEFRKYRRDFYKVLVLAMKQKISMNKIVEYKKAE